MDEGPTLSPPDPPAETSTFRAFKREQLLFNRYQLQYELGRGGRGVVWLAHDRRLGCSVALKFLADQLLTEPDALDELRQETLLSRRITHPHIMRIYDFEQDDAAAAISMEYLDGCTLAQLRLRRPHYCFGPDELRPWIIELCEALHYAHSGPKVVHRDLKPSNLMISNDGHLKVTDFGIASVIADSMSRVTQIHGVSGTLGYMSPQQALGGKARETDDIYSVGAVIYELLTSKPPFFRGNVAAQIQSAIPPLMQERRAELGRDGDPDSAPSGRKSWRVAQAKNPQDRPYDAQLVADWIRNGFRAGQDVAASQTQPLPLPPPKTSRAVSPLVLAGTFLLGGGMVWMACAFVVVPAPCSPGHRRRHSPAQRKRAHATRGHQTGRHAGARAGETCGPASRDLYRQHAAVQCGDFPERREDRNEPDAVARGADRQRLAAHRTRRVRAHGTLHRRARGRDEGPAPPPGGEAGPQHPHPGPRDTTSHSHSHSHNHSHAHAER